MLGSPQSRLRKRSCVYILSFFSFFLVFLALPSFFSLKTRRIEAELTQARVLIHEENDSGLYVIQGNTLRPISDPSFEKKGEEEVRRMYVLVTGYSSSSWQTDDTPFITAAGTSVREGIVATNLLSFGTRIRIPQIYGDRVFVVEDRMHPRNSVHVDIWFPSYWEAKTFGVKRTYVEVLN